MDDMNTCIKGSISEHKAVIWLLEQGYEVFKNVNPTGPFDLMAIKPGETIYIDVKTACLGRNYGTVGFNNSSFHESAAKFSEVNKKLLYVFEDQVAWHVGQLHFDNIA